MSCSLKKKKQNSIWRLDTNHLTKYLITIEKRIVRLHCLFNLSVLNVLTLFKEQPLYQQRLCCLKWTGIVCSPFWRDMILIKHIKNEFILRLERLSIKPQGPSLILCNGPFEMNVRGSHAFAWMFHDTLIYSILWTTFCM